MSDAYTIVGEAGGVLALSRLPRAQAAAEFRRFVAGERQRCEQLETLAALPDNDIPMRWVRGLYVGHPMTEPVAGETTENIPENIPGSGTP